MIALTLAFILAAAPPLPRSAIIVDSKSAPNEIPIGNVQVIFTDGHSEMWTKEGKCLLPKVAASGMVGWLRYTHLGYRGYPAFDTLRVVWPDEHHHDFQADATYPYIEEWGFSDDDTAVIIKSRAAHGPANYRKFDLTTGKLIARAHRTDEAPLPDWAKPLGE